MIKAGLNNRFGVYSTRAASTSAARLNGVSLPIIIKTAGWKNVQTFARYYHKTIETAELYQEAFQRGKQMTND